MSADEIAAAAVRWNTLRREAVRLHAERNDRQCDNEPGKFADTGPSHVEGVPCWKPNRHDEDGEPHFAPREEWCVACSERQILHDQFRATCKARGVAMRSLQRLCAKATP